MAKLKRSLLQCRNCGGVYQDIDAQGVEYYHVCPAIPNPKYQPDPQRAQYDPREFIEDPQGRNENKVKNPKTGNTHPEKIGKGTETIGDLGEIEVQR